MSTVISDCNRSSNELIQQALDSLFSYLKIPKPPSPADWKKGSHLLSASVLFLQWPCRCPVPFLMMCSVDFSSLVCLSAATLFSIAPFYVVLFISFLSSSPRMSLLSLGGSTYWSQCYILSLLTQFANHWKKVVHINWWMFTCLLFYFLFVWKSWNVNSLLNPF